eukprot:gnl/TRDRNA2_/TRDRNA2_157800_c1_seq1.p1 gnl/TRDRNA2_/TRDRNA2_157800_c1~~gnl/TRDRNA2_/TRDRNA2_157800_c1_seq1.p1  ORF type:complete len:233 (+),score=44.53 gnl/TRDRNA2_/TRDRNA2_157800_c1_seq1:2-700(+)
MPVIDQNMPWAPPRRRDGLDYSSPDSDKPCPLENALQISGWEDPRWRMQIQPWPHLHSASVFINRVGLCDAEKDFEAALGCAEDLVERSFFLSAKARDSCWPSKESFNGKGRAVPEDFQEGPVAKVAAGSLLRKIASELNNHANKARATALEVRYWAFDFLTRGCDAESHPDKGAAVENAHQNLQRALADFRVTENHVKGSDIEAIVEDEFREFLQPFVELEWCGITNPVGI